MDFDFELGGAIKFSRDVFDSNEFVNSVTSIKNYDPTRFSKSKKANENSHTVSADANFLSNLVRDMLLEYYDPGYIDYPYSSGPGEDDEEPRDDYLEDWKSMELQVVQDKTRQAAIDLAKVLVKDLELFNDVIDLVGQNQSIGKEILARMNNKEDKQNNS